VHSAQYTNRLGQLSIVQWIQHTGSTTNLILLLNFLVASTKSAGFATVSNIAKQLLCTVRTVINEDCVSMIVAKNTALLKGTRK